MISTASKETYLQVEGGPGAGHSGPPVECPGGEHRRHPRTQVSTGCPVKLFRLCYLLFLRLLLVQIAKVGTFF